MNGGFASTVTITLSDLSRAVNDHLGWKPKEEEALTKLIKQCSSVNFAEFIASMPWQGTAGSNTADGVAKAIYKTRNSIAHFRARDGDTTGVIWQDTIQNICVLLIELYNRYHAFL